MRVRFLPVIVVGISTLSTSFAQEHRSNPNSNSLCSTADQSKCCEMMLGRLEGAHHFCIEHGCNQNICSGKPSASGYDDNERGGGVSVKVKKDEGKEHDLDLDNYVDLWGSGGVTVGGKWSNDKVDSDRAALASASPSYILLAKRQQRRLAWSPPVWGAPTNTDPKTYYTPTPPAYYYPPPPPAPYYYYPPPPAPEFVETCCTSGEKACPMEFPMEKQVLLSGTVRVCCFMSHVYDYGGGGYQTQTPLRHGYGYGGYGYGNRKLQNSGGMYDQPPYSYDNSYGLPAQCPAPQNTPIPTRLPTRPPIEAPTQRTLSPTTDQPTTNQPSLSLMPSTSSKPSASSKPSESSEPSLSSKPSSMPSISSKPSESSEPSLSSKPSLMPSISSKPSASSKPSTSSKPSLSSMPSTSSKPSESSEPSLSSKPSLRTSPSLSDKRLKRDIAYIGSSPSGIPIYTFKYRAGMKLANNNILDTKSTFVGAMAQDLLELAPDAVIRNTEDGYYRVDYSKIDVDFYTFDEEVV